MKNNQPINILLLNALDIYGGGEFFVYQLGKKLTQNGHNVWISCREESVLYSKSINDGIKVFPVDYPPNSGKGKLWKNSKILARFIKENKKQYFAIT